MGGPELELCVACCSQPDEVFLAAIVHLDTCHRLRVAAIERLGKPQNRRKRADGLPLSRAERAEVAVRFFRRRLSMIPRHERDDLGFCRLEAAQVAVLDEIVRVLVMTWIADVTADVVQQGRELEPLTLAIGQHVRAARLIEDRQRQPRDLVGVLGPVAAAFGQLDDAATPNVWILAGLCDVPAIALDVIEHEAFAQREIAQRDLRCIEPLQHGVEQHGAGHDEIGATRVETRHLHPLPDASLDKVLAKLVNLPGRHAQVANLVARAPALG